ncbi:uncharacterized protein LOC132309900 [Cornus florida]|uniref:uncharacterized protein LOC132309900 n=1 Tax=Cornus florida TaxID=4283 RepID=UPI0028A11047|nr:uncharacterized protein LOC132309900 [Cornus florida]
MGNCIETIRHSEEVERGEEEVKNGGFVKENGGMRIKVVLTKEESELLLFQLKNKGEKMRLEDVLGEIERGREQRVAAGWKPSLESIMESPEVLLEMNK